MEHSEVKWKIREVGIDENWRILFTNIDGFQVCGIWPGKSASKFLTIEQHKANASLIAAAPALLEACKIGLGYIQNSAGCIDPSCAICKVKQNNIKTVEKAIAEAEK